jgi:aspartyl-tRNA(Asn)/glutamyl-tRNA(Gln) amidotransferase subunit B
MWAKAGEWTPAWRGSMQSVAVENLADEIIESQGLKQISDSGELEKLVTSVISENSKSVEEFKAGKEKAFNALVGQVMKAARGKANPTQVNEILRKKLME